MKNQKHKSNLEEEQIISIRIDNSTDFKDFLIEDESNKGLKTLLIQLSPDGVSINDIKIPNHLKPHLIEFLTQKI